jgi:hypothetical protein
MLDVIPPHIRMKEPNDGNVETSQRSLQNPRRKQVAAKLDHIGSLGEDDLAQPPGVGKEVVTRTRGSRWTRNHVGGWPSAIGHRPPAVGRSPFALPSRHHHHMLDIRILRQPARLVLEIDTDTAARLAIELGDVEQFQLATTSS